MATRFAVVSVWLLQLVRELENVAGLQPLPPDDDSQPDPRLVTQVPATQRLMVHAIRELNMVSYTCANVHRG